MPEAKRPSSRLPKLSQEEIARRAAEVRANWSEEQEERRRRGFVERFDMAAPVRLGRLG